jgi:hypothetical protein
MPATSKYEVRLIPENSNSNEPENLILTDILTKTIDKVGFVGIFGNWISFFTSKGEESTLLDSYPAHRVLSIHRVS